MLQNTVFIGFVKLKFLEDKIGPLSSAKLTHTKTKLARQELNMSQEILRSPQTGCQYGRGRVYEIIDYGQLLAGLPAPTKFNIIQVRISPKMI